jgi:processive 1,2-diacylglycerol beta-glucosyltransferase
MSQQRRLWRKRRDHCVAMMSSSVLISSNSSLLVLGGGFGMGPVAEIMRELDKVPHQFQIIVVAGRNEKLRRKLAAQTYKHPTRILGFSINMHELMSVADLIITKPGGLTTSEALAMGKPLFILNPIPGQEGPPTAIFCSNTARRQK